MTNFDIVNLINTLRGKDIQGEDVRISEMQNLINTHSQLLFAEKTSNPQRPDAPLENKGVGLSRKVQNELRPFYVRKSLSTPSGVGDLSAENMGYLVAIEPTSITGRGFDELTGDEVADRLGSSVVAPTLKDPALEWTGQDTFITYPTMSSVVLKYYKYPTDCVIAVTTNSTTLLEEYDAANSTELEWYDEQKTEIAYRVYNDLMRRYGQSQSN